MRDRDIFENQLPERLKDELDLAEELGVKPLKIGESGFDDAINEGTIKWAVKINGENSPFINHSWAKIATSIYDYLAQRAGSGGESFLISSMLLRAAMIAEFGAIPGDPVLDINKVINWFYKSLKMSLDEAMTKADN